MIHRYQTYAHRVHRSYLLCQVRCSCFLLFHLLSFLLPMMVLQVHLRTLMVLLHLACVNTSVDVVVTFFHAEFQQETSNQNEERIH